MDGNGQDKIEYRPGSGGAADPEAELSVYRYESAVRQLISQQGDEPFPWEEFRRYTGVQFTGDLFLLAELEDDPRHPSGPPPEPDRRSPAERYQVLRSCVLGVLGRDHPAVACNQYGRMLCVLNWQWDETNWQLRFTELMAELNEALEAQFHFQFQSTVSRMCRGAEKIPEADQELDQARNYRKMLGGLPGEIVFYDGILRTTGLENRGSQEEQEERQRMLFQALLQGDASTAKEIFHTEIQDYFMNSRPAVKFVQLRFFEVVDRFLKTLEKAADELGRREDLRDLQPGPRLLGAENISRLEEEADALLDEFCTMVGQNGVQARLPNRIRTYILEHYQDPNLNVNRVADVFQVTPTYATRIFKQEFQCGILAYIQKVRVEEAKHLLDSTHTIREVAEKVGFSTSSALIRSFKKLEGMTPAQYSQQRQPRKDA